MEIPSSVSTTSYTAYDPLERATATSQMTNGQTYPFPTYTYNRAGEMTAATYPSGR